ncbi:hypothetical protein PILCRDRAFT_826413, partial [Piloderma croceum F 1598]
MDSSYDELLCGYKLEKQMLMKSLEGMKIMLVSMINFMQENSKAKEGDSEMRTQKERRLFQIYTCSEDIPQVQKDIG